MVDNIGFLLKTVYHFFTFEEEQKIYATIGSPEEVHAFFERMNTLKEPAEDAIIKLSRGNNGGGMPANPR